MRVKVRGLDSDWGLAHISKRVYPPATRQEQQIMLSVYTGELRSSFYARPTVTRGLQSGVQLRSGHTQFYSMQKAVS